MWLALAAVALALGPAAVNGDGVGYLKAARDGVLYPGHLGYVPLLAAAWRGCAWLGLTSGPATGPLAGGIVPGRLLSALGAGGAAAALGAWLERRTGDHRRALVGAVGLFCSAGLLITGTDLETYAPATCLLVATLLLLGDGFGDDVGVGQAALAGLVLGAAILLHIENLLFALPACLLCARWRARASLVGCLLLVLVAAYAPLDPRALLQVTHGFHYPLHAWTPLVAIWGALRALVYAPYPYEATWATVVGSTALGVLVAALLAGHALRGDGAVLPRRVVLAWLAPYALVGTSFFASDSERWIFLLPLLWATVAVRTRPRALLAIVGLLCLGNAVTWLPSNQVTNVVRARAAAALLAPGDLLLSPGHGWDESIALYAPPDVATFPLVFFAATGGGPDGLGRALDQAIAAMQRRGGRLLAVRLDGGADPSDPLGWKELALLGLPRDRLSALLAHHGLVAGAPLGAGIVRWTLTSSR